MRAARLAWVSGERGRGVFAVAAAAVVVVLVVVVGAGRVGGGIVVSGAEFRYGLCCLGLSGRYWSEIVVEYAM